MKTFVDLIEVIAWPTVVLIVIYYLKPVLTELIGSIRGAQNFEMEIGGQKLKIENIDNSIRKSIEEGVALSKADPEKGIDEYVRNRSELIAILAELTNNQVNVLEFVHENPGAHTKQISSVFDELGNTFETDYRKTVKIMKELREHRLVKRESDQGTYLYNVTKEGAELYGLIQEDNSI